MSDIDERITQDGNGMPMLTKGCKHKSTHNEDWPDGGGIEVCDVCGTSRYIWEQGESPWMMIDIEKTRAEVEAALKAKGE